MRVPVVSGIVTNEHGDFLVSNPLNREPVLRDTGISEGYLRPPLGITQVATGPGPDRGGITWNGVCYRVMGTKLVSVASDWTVTVLGDVGGSGFCGLDYSFDNLIINSGTNLFYWNAADGLRQVTDPDLGAVLDAIYVDGYTMTTDGSFIVVTDLNDPMSVNPLRYGSAEQDPDPLVGLVSARGEVYGLGANTIQVFQNVGGNGFPFTTIKTAIVPYGCVGARAKCRYVGTVAFVGGARNEAPGVWLMGPGNATKLSSAEVDDELAALSDAELAAVVLEARVQTDDQRLILHLPSHSWGFSEQITVKAQVKTWCKYTSGITDGRYDGQGLARCYGKWIVGSSTGQIGYLDESVATHYGATVGWRFDTTLLYNNTQRAILNRLELVGTPGRGAGDDRVFMSYTKDGVYWSQERAVSAGKPGETQKRLQWRGGTRFENYIGLRFRGFDGSLAGIAAIEASIEALAA